MTPRAQRFDTYVAAARIAGVSPSAIREWIRKGWLSPGPWTHAEIIKAASAGRQSRGRGITAEHGTASRWRAGCDCKDCLAAHNSDTRDRRAAARAQWWSDRADALIKALAAGDDYGQTLAEMGITPQAVTSRRRVDPGFARDIDDALTAGRDPNLVHGTMGAWRARCRCPDCREEHEKWR